MRWRGPGGGGGRKKRKRESSNLVASSERAPRSRRSSWIFYLFHVAGPAVVFYVPLVTLNSFNNVHSERTAWLLHEFQMSVDVDLLFSFFLDLMKPKYSDEYDDDEWYPKCMYHNSQKMKATILFGRYEKTVKLRVADEVSIKTLSYVSYSWTLIRKAIFKAPDGSMSAVSNWKWTNFWYCFGLPCSFHRRLVPVLRKGLVVGMLVVWYGKYPVFFYTKMPLVKNCANSRSNFEPPVGHKVFSSSIFTLLNVSSVSIVSRPGNVLTAKLIYTKSNVNVVSGSFSYLSKNPPKWTVKIEPI